MDFCFLLKMWVNSQGMLAMRQKILDRAKPSATDAFETVSNRSI